MELDQTVSLIDNIYNLSGQNAVAEGDHRADLTFFARFYKGFPDIIFLTFQQKDLDLCLCALFYSIKSCRYYLRIINNQTISRS